MLILVLGNLLGDSGGGQSRRQGVDQLLSSLLVLDDQSVKLLRSSDLELGLSRTGSLGTTVLLDGSGGDVLSSGKFEELLDVGEFLLKKQLVIRIIFCYTFVYKRNARCIWPAFLLLIQNIHPQYYFNFNLTYSHC